MKNKYYTRHVFLVTAHKQQIDLKIKLHAEFRLTLRNITVQLSALKKHKTFSKNQLHLTVSISNFF